MKTLGYNLAGCEAAFEKHLTETIQNTSQFTYLEVGIAEGTTLLAVADLARKLMSAEGDWTVIGVDLLDGPFFKPIEFARQAQAIGLGVEIQVPFELSSFTPSSGLYIMLANDPHKFTTEIALLDFVLIDGCHGAPCVKADFLAIEKQVYQGGIVAFHDACVEDQGRDMQQHCGEPINVRQALYDLNLLQPPPEHGKDWQMRDGWELVEEVHGDKSANPPGNGMIFFRKV